MTADQDPAALAREALELAEQATPGPWMYDVGEMQWLPSPSERFDATEGRKGWVGEASNDFDGAFVAHAGTHYATLARATLALTEERDALLALLLEAREALVPDNGSIGDRERFEVGQRIDAALRGKEKP